MNANQIWKILRAADLEPANSPSFYGKGALLKRAGSGWRIIPCSASLLDPYRLYSEAQDAIRTALTDAGLSFEERSDGFYLT